LDQKDVITLIDEPTFVADLEGFVTEWVQDHRELLKSRGTYLDYGDKRLVVRWIWEALNNPDRPCDPASVHERVRMIVYFERLFRTQIQNKGQLGGLVERFLGGRDGRKLSISQAIRRARRKLKQSQWQLAEHLGLKDHTLISKYESGRREPSKKVLEWLKETESVTEKRPVRHSSRTPSFSVTSLWGKSKPISASSSNSETLPKQPKCTSPIIPPQTAGAEEETCPLQAGYPSGAEETASLGETPEAAPDSKGSIEEVNHGE